MGGAWAAGTSSFSVGLATGNWCVSSPTATAARHPTRLTDSRCSCYTLLSGCAEEAEAARKRLKQLEDRQRLACRPSTSASSASAPASERPFTAPAAATLGPTPAPLPAPRPLTRHTVERSGSSASAGVQAEAECQPNPVAPLLRDEQGRREWVEGELDAYCSSYELQASAPPGRGSIRGSTHVPMYVCCGSQTCDASWFAVGPRQSGVRFLLASFVPLARLHGHLLLSSCPSRACLLALHVCPPACLPCFPAESGGRRAGTALRGAAQAAGCGEGSGCPQKPRVVGARPISQVGMAGIDAG